VPRHLRSLAIAIGLLAALPRPAAALAMVDFASSDGAFGIQALSIDFGDDLVVTAARDGDDVDDPSVLGDAGFLNALLADLHALTGKLRAHGAEVLLVRPPTLAGTPAAWLRFGARWRPGTVRQALRRDPRVRALGAAGTRWSKGAAALAEAYGARFVDLAHIADAALVRAAGEGIGLPPQCGGDTDLFFDALHLSDLGSRLAADRMAEALDVGV